MVWIISDRSLASSGGAWPACRCGNPALADEACHVCEQLVCAACAAFIDPQSRRQERPSHLMARSICRNFLAHHACLSDTNPRMTAMIETRDVPRLVGIMRRHGEAFTTLDRTVARRPLPTNSGPQREAPALVRTSND